MIPRNVIIEVKEQNKEKMIQKLIKRFLGHKHYWRDIGFDELSELYTSMTFRSLAQSIVGIFIPIYLYNLDKSIGEIFFFFAQVYIFWQIAAIAAAWIVARYGPKHTILLSHVLIIVAMGMLISLTSTAWPLMLIAFFLGVSNGLFFVAFHVDFSKVKHSEHGGKEVGWMFTMQKVGLALGPIVGGVVAYLFGAQYIFLVSTILLFVGVVPLFLSAEPVKVHQRVAFPKLALRDVRRDLFSFSALGVENVSSMIVWPFFMGIVIFADNAYLNVGIIISASVAVTFIASRSIGSLIDKKKGRQLLRAGVVLNALLHLVRVFARGFPITFLVNVVNEAITPMYRMPMFKGVYDAADDYPGRRIVYMSSMESTSAFARALFFFVAGILAYLILSATMLFGALFAITAVVSLLIATERFRALN